MAEKYVNGNEDLVSLLKNQEGMMLQYTVQS